MKEQGIIVDRENIGSLMRDYRSMNRFLFQGPSLHIVVVTLRCNQKCIYCQAKSPDAKKSDMDVKTAGKMLEFVFRAESPAISIEFQGGEPLLNWDTVKFVVAEAGRLNKEYEKRDLKISLVSNLTMMDEEKLKFLHENGVSICTSLDGPKGVHDSNRKLLGGGGTYDKVVEWISRIKEVYGEAAETGLAALPTITRNSLPHWKGIVDEYIKHGFDNAHLRFLNRLGAAQENWDRIAYTPKQFAEFWKKGLDYIIELNKEGVRIMERGALIMLSKILGKLDYGYTELMSPCGAGRTQMAYNHNGDIYTCDEGRMLGADLFKLGNVHETAYEDIFRSENQMGVTYASALENYTSCQVCAFKPYCGTCPVMNYVEQGNIIPKMTQTMRHAIYKFQFSHLFNRMGSDPEVMEIFRNWVKLSDDSKVVERKFHGCDAV